LSQDREQRRIFMPLVRIFRERRHMSSSNRWRRKWEKHIRLRIPAMPITHSDLMAITIPSDADHRRSEATLGCSYHAEVIGISQGFCC
jgi:hypothetical protein